MIPDSRFPIGRDSEIARTGFLCIFCQILYTLLVDGTRSVTNTFKSKFYI